MEEILMNEGFVVGDKENKITYEQIAKANKEIKLIDIKGKNYAVVSERINAFRKLFPNGTIETKIIDCENGVVLMRAEILNEDGKLLATGYAQEKESSSFINNTSYIENCETSAVGRALSMLGVIGGDSVASAEEVGNEIKQQESVKKVNKETGEVEEKKVLYATQEQVEKIKELLPVERIVKLLQAFKIERLEDLTIQDASKVIAKELKANDKALKKALDESTNE